jgi:hypothetical protein
LIQKNADPRARSGRLLAVTVTWWVRWVAGSANVLKNGYVEMVDDDPMGFIVRLQ